MRDWLQRRLDAEARYGLRLTLLALALVLVAVPFGWLLNQIEDDASLVRLDTALARRLHSWVAGSPGAVQGLKVVSFLGAPVWCYLLVVPTAVLLLRRHLPRLAVFLVATVAGGGLLGTAVKVAVNRSRPSFVDPVATAYGHSFPSGHAMTSTILYGALLMVVLPVIPRNRRLPLIAAAILLVLLIGFARLALGVHYLSDVVAGYLLGFSWLAASVSAFRTWRVERGRPAAPALDGLEPEAVVDPR